MKSSLFFLLVLSFHWGSGAIFGGENVDSGSELARTVVGLYSEGDGGDIGLCTGVLLSPTRLLTAAHCVEDSRRRLFYFRAVEFTRAFNRGRLKASRISPHQIVIHHSYLTDSKSRQGDIAIIKLEHPLTGNAEPVTVADENDIKTLSTVTAIGYGNALDDSGGLLRTTTLQFFRLKHSFAAEFDQSAGRGFCVGDSGGPALIRNPNGHWRVVGIAAYATSLGDQPNCTHTGGYLLLSDYRQWIVENL